MSAAYRTCGGIAWRTVDENTFVYGSDGRLHILEGPVAALLWSQLDSSPQSKEHLVEMTKSAFAVTPEVAQKDVEDFLDSLRSTQLIEEIN